MVKIKLSSGIEAEMSVEEFVQMTTGIELTAHDTIDEAKEHLDAIANGEPWNKEDIETMKSEYKNDHIRFHKIKEKGPYKKKRQHKIWSKREDEIITSMFKMRKTDKHIAKVLSRTVDGVKNRRKNLGIVLYHRMSVRGPIIKENPKNNSYTKSRERMTYIVNKSTELMKQGYSRSAAFKKAAFKYDHGRNLQ
jgi:hypothetical protein